MTNTQLVQMALSAIIRCNERISLMDLIHILKGRSNAYLSRNGFDKIKTFGAGKLADRKQWLYWIIQMIQQKIIDIDYDDHDYLKVLEKGHLILKGELEADLKHQYKEFNITKNDITIKIDSDIQDLFDWKKQLSELNSIIYWNYKEVRRIDVDSIIPQNIEERERVKAKFLEIASQLYHLHIEGNFIVISKKVDYDILGNIVPSLSFPFYECLAKLENFIKTNGRYPQMNAVAEEAALRKWYREVGHGIIEISPQQQEVFKQFKIQYPISKSSRNGNQ